MTARLYFHGIEISVPTGELAEALRQIASAGTLMQRASGATPRPRDALAPWPMPPGTDIRPALPVKSAPALAFLELIEQYGVSGLKVEGIMQLLSVANPKGIGSKSASINRQIKSCGFEIDEVYTNPRDSAGDRWWKPGPRIKEAIKALESGVPGA